MLSDLRQKLEIRYERSKKSSLNDAEQMEVESLEATETYTPSSDITLKLPETPTDDPLHGDNDTFISCDQLYHLLLKIDSRYLIIDIRQKTHFDSSKISSDKCINIPQSEIKPG